MTASRPALRRAALVLLLLAALALAVLSLADQWTEARTGAARLSTGHLAAAAAAVLLSLGFSLLSWRSTLAGLGTALPVPTAARIYYLGQLGKYLPGSVWPVVAQMELGSAYGLSRSAIATASLLAMAVAVPVALVLGGLAVPALLAADASAYLLLFLVLPVSAVALSPRVLDPVLARVLRLAGQPALPQRLGPAAVLRVALLAAGAHLLLGVQAWLLARDLGAEGALVLPLAVGAFSLANVAGLLALPVPAGAGVREAVLVVALSPVLPAGQALVLALVSRLLLTAGDLVVAGAAAHATRGRRGQTAVPEADEEDEQRRGR